MPPSSESATTRTPHKAWRSRLLAARPEQSGPDGFLEVEGEVVALKDRGQLGFPESPREEGFPESPREEDGGAEEDGLHGDELAQGGQRLLPAGAEAVHRGVERLLLVGHHPVVHQPDDEGEVHH